MDATRPLFSMPGTQKAALDYGSIPHVVADKFMRLGIPSAMAGGAGAVLVKILADIKQNQRDREMTDGKGNPQDTIVVNLPSTKFPQKMAEVAADALCRSSRNHTQAPDFPAYVLAAGEAFEKYAEGISDYFRGIIPRHPGKMPANLFVDNAATTAAVGIPLAMGYKVVDDYFRRKEEGEIDKETARLKDEYANLLLRELRGGNLDQGTPKTAAFGPLDAMADIAVDQLDMRSDYDTSKVASADPSAYGPLNALANITSIPVSIALMAGIMSHKFRLNKERELDAYYDRQTPKLAPPTRIKLTSSQEEPQEAQKAAAIGVGPTLLAIKLIDMVGDRGVMQDISAKEEAAHTQELRDQTAKSQATPMEEIDHNSVLVNRPNQQIQVDAADPGAQAFLESNKELLLDALT